MNARIDFQTILARTASPPFVVVPYNEFRRMAGGFTPERFRNTVVNAMFDGPMSST